MTRTWSILLIVTGALLTIAFPSRSTACGHDDVHAAAQAASGRVIYDARCASCHQADLRGFGEAPPLSGAAFRTRWLDSNVESLGNYIQSTMPPVGNRLTANDALNVTAFLALINRPLNGASSPIPAACRCSGARTDTCGAAARDLGRRHGRGLRAGDRRDAARSTARRLADGAAQLSGLELQPARRDHPRQRQRASPGVDVGDERSGWREPADAARPQRHHLSGRHRRRGSSARTEEPAI